MKSIKFRDSFKFHIGHNYTLRRPTNKYKVGQKVRLTHDNDKWTDKKTAIIQAIRFIRFSDIESYRDWHLSADPQYQKQLYSSYGCTEESKKFALEIMQEYYPAFWENDIVEQIFFTVIKE